MLKLVIIITFIVFCLVGCAITDQAIDDYNACLNDTECFTKIMVTKNLSKEVTSHAVDSSRYGELVGGVVGIIASAIAGVIYGRQKRKQV